MTKQKIASDRGDAAGRDVTAVSGPTNNVIAIHGGTNIIGNQGPVHVYTRDTRPPPAPTPPPPDHITEEQAATLKRLHDDWVALAEAVKTRAKPITPQQAWININRAGHCTTYKHMRQERFESVCTYVQQQMAILRSGKTARSRDPKWRSSRIGAIKARSINQLGNEFVYLPYIKKSFNAQSLTELDDEQIEATYRHVLKLKPRSKVE